MRQQATERRRDYYCNEDSTFETYDQAGWLDVNEDVLAASPDIISVSVGTSFYQAGRSHSDGEGVSHFVWSRRLDRPLTQDGIFAVPPDRALRRLALSRFDNRDRLQNPDDPDGISLPWDHASIGPEGITWSFAPYELGGYTSGGSAMVEWSSLEPYLRRQLPFVIGTIRGAAPQPEDRGP